MSHRMLAVRLASWLIALYAGTAGASIYTVGGDAACSHTDIDAALESARTNPGFDTVRIARSQDYFDVDVSTDTSDDLDILGGYPSCAATQTDGTRTTVRGDTSGGGSGDQEPVFRINVDGGATVRMKGLNITKGDEDGDGKGGGVHLSGAGTFRIDDSAVYGNTAGNGGGIGVDGANGFNLVIGADVTISGNNARYNGGGVYIGDYCHLTMIASGSVIALNKALGTDNGNGVIGGYGGGVAVIGAADASVGSGGQGNLGAIYGNEARYGGGVYLKNTQHYGANPATFNLYTTEPLHPGAIRSNFAHNAGGGIYAEPQKDYLDPVDKAYVRIFDANVEDNSAPQGAAIHLSSDTDAFGTTSGADLFINTGPRPGGTTCDSSVRCSRIGGNDNVDENNAPTDGAAIYAGDDASAQMENVILEGNTGHEVIRGNSAGDGVGIVLQDSLVADNSVASAVIRTNGESPVTLRRLTIAGNSIGGSYVLDLSDAITLESSIVYQPGFLVTAPGGGTRDIEDVLANEIDSIDTGQRLLAAVPRFVDPAGSDYHLRAASPAVDYAPTSFGYDLDGQPRGVDLALVANIYGASDLGAYERQQVGNLLHNPYFNGDFHFWEVITPDAVSYSAQNYATPATGSAYVNYAATDVYALTQCVHLPGPGTYALSGTGYSPGFTRLDHDQLFLDWQLRFAGSEACNAGAPEQSGELFVAGTGSWTTSDPPAIIAITPEQWTPSSSVAVFLKVHDTGVTAPSASGYFDDLSLVPAGDSVEDRVFADDFEGP